VKIGVISMAVLSVLVGGARADGPDGSVAIRTLISSARQIIRELDLPDVADVVRERGTEGLDGLVRVNERRLDLCTGLTELVDGATEPTNEGLLLIRAEIRRLHATLIDVSLVPRAGPVDGRGATALALALAYVDCARVVVRRRRDGPVTARRRWRICAAASGLCP